MPVGTESTHIPHGDLSALLRVSLALAESLDLNVVLQTAIEGAVDVLELGTGAAYLLQGDELYLGATTPPLPPDFPSGLRRAALADHPHIVRAIHERHPVFVPDTRLADFTPQERAAVDARRLCSVLYVPLVLHDHVEGVLIVGTQDEVLHEFVESDIDLCLTLSAQVALAIANAKLYESVQAGTQEIRAAYDATLEGWGLALELRDEATSGHTQRAAELTVELARVLGVPECDIPDVRRGALLHDIGKMGVPDAILHKAGPLDDAEWAIMRQHPVHAREFLRRIDYLSHALDIPYFHHERWDGSGYPLGLTGDRIPLPARIFAVVDVFDALTSERPYRAAWSIDDALAHIQAGAGTHFDPAVVAAFFEKVGPPRR